MPVYRVALSKVAKTVEDAEARGETVVSTTVTSGGELLIFTSSPTPPERAWKPGPETRA